MDKQTATQLIGDTFNYPFDEGQFRNFAINLLNDVDETKGFDYLTGTFIRHSFKDHITKYRRLGTYTDPNGETIDVLVVELKNKWALERSRTMLRNFTSDYLKNRDEKDAALVAYYTSNPEDWRFSYIKMEYKRVQTESGKFKIKEDVTPAKRYSFLVGKNEPNHTAQAQLVGILADDRNNPTLTELETAFSVDAVTKQFYKDYRAQFEKLWNELNDIVSKDHKISAEFESKTIDTANFAKKLMGQIVFLYFLQKKGWLGVGKDSEGNFKDWGTGPKNFLRRLYDKEFTDYSNFFNDVLEPLFYEALANERTSDVFPQFNCKIPFLNGGLFEPINNYNWEETDIRIDNDIIASVLGTFDQYNFTVREDEPLEKEVAVDPEMLGKVFENLLPENLRKGKGTYYTPRTIVHYMCQESLINYLDTECESVPKEDIETLIREGDIILELETAIVEQDKKYNSLLMDSIKDYAQVLDDALANIKVCDPAIGSGAFPVGMLTEIVKARTVLEIYLEKNHGVYELKRHCIQNSLYGVDIDPGAIEISKLRLWLSLVVDEDDYTTIQPLPNLDYKIMQGNSLIEEFHGISLDIEKKPDEQKDLFAGGSDLDTLINNLHQKQDDFFNAEHPPEKKQKRDAVETAIYNIFHSELEKKKNISPQEAKDIENDLKEMTHGNKERNFFPWKLYFADVFREKGGFNVVIANPPYKVLDKDEKINYSNYETFSTFELYSYFFELSIKKILNQYGCISFITASLFIKGMKFISLRNFLTSNINLSEFFIAGDKVFEQVQMPTSVLVGKKSDDIKQWVFEQFIPNYDLLSKFEHKSIPLDSITRILRGFEIGKDKVLDISDIEFITGSDIQKWCTKSIRYISKPTYKKYKKDEIFFTDNRLLIRETGSRLTALYLNKTLYSNRSLYSIKILNSDFSYLYVLGLLNSNILQFYYQTRFKSETDIFPKIRIAQVKQMPIKVANNTNQSRISSLVDRILTTKKTNPQADTTGLEAEIDQMVYELYGLTEEEIQIVEESVG